MITGVGERIIIPRDAAELVLLQRTGHSVIGRIPGIRRLLPVVGYRPLLKMEARVRSAAIVTDYADEIGFDGCADLVISLLSWGYHYPLGFYWDRVLKVLPPSGTLIVDLRQAEDFDEGMPLIRSQFDVLAQQPIHAGVRVIARRAARADP